MLSRTLLSEKRIIKMFKAQKVSRSRTILLKGSFERVFPLFGPIREKDWAEGWDPHILLSEAENIEEHMVFQTASHFKEEQEHYTWTVSKYEPDQGLIEYTVFADTRLWWITILCREGPDEAHSKATITYTYVGLSEVGNQSNTIALKSMFKHDLKDWEQALNHFLDTGQVWKQRHEPE
jgi:hypothetical protein